MIYCVVQPELAPQLGALARLFGHDDGVEVVLDRRAGDRRSGANRRLAEPVHPFVPERRAVRGGEGRRVGERRAPLVGAQAPEMPRRVRRHAERLVFLERLEPPAERVEDMGCARLAIRGQAGDADAVEELHERWFERLFNYLLIALDDPDEAEEAVQEVFDRAVEALPGYDPHRMRVRAWLASLLSGCAMSETSERLMALDGGADGEADGEDGEEAKHEAKHETEAGGGWIGSLNWLTDEDLLLLVRRMPAAHRQVVMLRYMLALGHGEIAAVAERSPAEVRKLEECAIRFLEDRLYATTRRTRHSERHAMRRLPSELWVLRRRQLALKP